MGEVPARVKIAVGQITIELEGTEAFVREELRFFKDKWLKKGPREPEDAPPLPRPPAPAGGKPTIKQLMAQKSPESDMDAAAVVAYFLAQHEGMKEIDKKLLSEWTTKAGRKPPKAPGQTLTDAKRKKGYFDKGSTKEKFKLSDTGRYLVEQELPRARP